MPPKRKNRPLLSRHYLKNQKSHRTKNDREPSATKFLTEALDMAQNLGVKVEAILKKLETLDVIELQLREVCMKVANIEETVSRLDPEVQVLKTRTDETRNECEGT